MTRPDVVSEEVWECLKLAIKVCAKKASISQLRRALREAKLWPPSAALKGETDE